MKSICKNITVGFLVVVMLVSTMGFSINTMYCFCMGEYEVSLFEIDHTCQKEEPLDPEIAKLPPCCQKAMLACHKPTKEHQGCEKHEKKYLKADLKFLEFSKNELPKPPFFAIQPSYQYPFFTTSKVSFISEIQPKIADRAPPQYYGRKLLNFIQVYRC